MEKGIEVGDKVRMEKSEKMFQSGDVVEIYDVVGKEVGGKFYQYGVDVSGMVKGPLLYWLTDDVFVPICERHGDKLFHDGKEEWFCPFCGERR